ncbi:MAG: magnesium transporter CorA family protein [Thermoprotei archaeon]|jgi:magnesium transporter
MRIAYIVYDSKKIEEKGCNEVVKESAKEKCLIMVYAENVDEVFASLDQLNISMPIKLSKDDIKRSRLIVDERLILVLQLFRVRDHEIDDMPLLVVLYRNTVIVISLFQEFLGKIKECLVRDDYRVRELGVDVLFSVIMNELINEYYGVVDLVDEWIDELEDLVVKEPAKIDIGMFRDIRSNLIVLRRAFYFIREYVSLLLGKGVYKLSAESERLLREFYEDSAHLIELIESQKERLADIRDLHLSSISLSLNIVMKKLTAINVIALPLIIIAGIYGMNLEIPEARLPYAYPVILTVMITFAVVLVFFFRKIGWF